MERVSIKIEGMSCQHCVNRVKKALDAIAGVSRADVSIGVAEVEFDNSKTSIQEVVSAIQNAGYKVISH